MSARYLLVALLLFVIIGVAITSRSTLTPEYGVDHVFYAGYSDFMAQEAATGNFNGDAFGDVVTTIKWDDPTTCGATEKPVSQATACGLGWTKWIATKQGQPTKTLCRFPPGPLRDLQEDYWLDCGWTLTPVDSCAACVEAQWYNENKGAAYVFEGGTSWASKGHDINLATGTGADHMVRGHSGGDLIYNGIGAGDITTDAYGCDELVLGAEQAGFGPGEVYVIGGNTPVEPWPALGVGTINPPGDALVDYYFRGRDMDDRFGLGIVVGDLNADGKADVVVAAPAGDGEGNGLANSGEIYIFYSTTSLPAVVDLSTMADNDFVAPSGAASNYAQVMWGAAAGDETGVTLLEEIHEPHHGLAAHQGDYEPVGLAIGDWNGDGLKDLAIGAGLGWSGDGAVYVLFGAPSSDPTRKLRPGKTIYFSHTAGSGDGPDIRVIGKSGSRLGAGVAFVDADGEGVAAQPPVFGKDDLVMGAPYADLGGLATNFEYYGEAYIIWGDTKAALTSNPHRQIATPGDVNVTIRGQYKDDQIGGHIAGNFDVDHDGKNEIGIAGSDVSFVLFGQSRSEWESTVDLETILSANPETRVLKWTSDPTPNSMTIKLLKLDEDIYSDLVFGGYDNAGFPGGEAGVPHAGQMWVTKGWDMWKKGTIAANTTWTGIVFVDGDITVQSGATLTIAQGSHVWVWQADALRAGADPDRIEINVEGSLVVNGTAANPVIFESWDWQAQTTEDWVGFYFDSASGGGTFTYCTIKRAEYAVESYVPLTLRHCTIQDGRYAGVVSWGGTVLVENSSFADPGSFGVYLSNSSCTIRNTTIDGATGVGVEAQPTSACAIRNAQFLNCDMGVFLGTALTSSVDSTCVFQYNNIGVHCYGTGTTPTIKNSTISNNSGDGILCDNVSHPLIQGNTMRYNGAAVYCTNSSSPTIASNTITSNTNGIGAASGSNPDIGHDQTGNNTIAFTTNYHVSNFTANTIWARHNCWNNNISPCKPKASKIMGDVDREGAICCTVSEGSAPESQPAPEPKPAVRTALAAIVPNPFNPTTTIHYGLAVQGTVSIVVYDVAGRFVRELVRGTKTAGTHDAVWDGTDRRGVAVASGIYFVRMAAGGNTFTMKMMLLK